MARHTGIAVSREVGLSICEGANNDTVIDCPISDNKNDNKTEFIVVAHNAKSQKFDQFIRVKVPNTKFQAQLWSKKEGKFVDVESDILEQKHLTNTRVLITDFEMFIPCDMEANEVSFVKIKKIAEPIDKKFED